MAEGKDAVRVWRRGRGRFQSRRDVAQRRAQVGKVVAFRCSSQPVQQVRLRLQLCRSYVCDIMVIYKWFGALRRWRVQEVIEELTSSSQRYVHHKRDAVMALVRSGCEKGERDRR